MTNRKSQNGPLVPKKAWIAFFFWLFPIPLVTLWTLWKLTQPNMNNAGYLLPAFAIVSVLGVTIAALIIGALTRTAGASFMGVLVSVPVAFALGSVTINRFETAQQSRPDLAWQSRTGPKYAEMTNMIAVLLGGDRAATAHAIRERAHLSNRVALIAPVRFQRQ